MAPQVILVLLAIALSSARLPPDVYPWPIGIGPRFELRAAPAAVLAGKRLERLDCERGGKRFGVHVELFVHRRVLIIPAGIGVARPWREHAGRFTPIGCTYPVRTLEPTGVIEVREAARLTLRDVFRLWGQPIGRTQLAGFRGKVLVFINGKRRFGDPGAVPLTRHAEIVLELGGYLPPHSRYLFAAAL